MVQSEPCYDDDSFVFLNARDVISEASKNEDHVRNQFYHVSWRNCQMCGISRYVHVDDTLYPSEDPNLFHV